MTKIINKYVSYFIPLSDSVMLLWVNAKPVNVNIVQVYAPTADKAEQEIKDFNYQIEGLLQLTKKQKITILTGEVNDISTNKHTSTVNLGR